MINSAMREYDYYLYSNEGSKYGQAVLSKMPVGRVKMSIHNTTTSTQDNVLYKDATYIGLTHDHKVDDAYVIQYGAERLKVLYVVPNGRYRQVFMKYHNG